MDQTRAEVTALETDGRTRRCTRALFHYSFFDIFRYFQMLPSLAACKSLSKIELKYLDTGNLRRFKSCRLARGGTEGSSRGMYRDILFFPPLIRFFVRVHRVAALLQIGGNCFVRSSGVRNEGLFGFIRVYTVIGQALSVF